MSIGKLNIVTAADELADKVLDGFEWDGSSLDPALAGVTSDDCKCLCYTFAKLLSPDRYSNCAYVVLNKCPIVTPLYSCQTGFSAIDGWDALSDNRDGSIAHPIEAYGPTSRCLMTTLSAPNGVEALPLSAGCFEVVCEDGNLALVSNNEGVITKHFCDQGVITVPDTQGVIKCPDASTMCAAEAHKAGLLDGSAGANMVGGLMVSSTYPSVAGAAGGAKIVVYGHGFDATKTYTVSVGGVPAESVEVITSMQMMAVVGAKEVAEATATVVDVIVTAASGESATGLGSFTYDPALAAGDFADSVPAAVTGSPAAVTTLAGYPSYNMDYYRVDRDLTKIQLVKLQCTEGFFSALLAIDTVPTGRTTDKVPEASGQYSSTLSGPGGDTIGVKQHWVALHNNQDLTSGTKLFFGVLGAVPGAGDGYPGMSGFTFELFEPTMQEMTSEGCMGSDGNSVETCVVNDLSSGLSYFKVTVAGPSKLTFSGDQRLALDVKPIFTPPCIFY
jgi:hypothetical protein